MTSVSIIIINYNTFQLTCNCIESILRTETNLKFEIILVDNASSEHDPSSFSEKFSQIILIKSPVNLGFAKGNNLGISRANGDYILLLNSDTVLLNDAITKCVNFLNSNKEIGVVSARLEYPDGKVQHNCQRFPSIKIKLFELLRLQKIFSKSFGGKVLFGSFFNYDSIAYPDWVWGTFFLFRKEALNKLPGKKLAGDFFMYVEDTQWCFDFSKLGYKIAFLPEAKVIHLMGSSGGTKNELILQNTELFMKKYYPGWKIFFIQWLDKLLS